MGCWRISASAPGRKWPYWPNPLGTTAPRITMKRPRPASSTIAGRIKCPESRMNFCTGTPVGGKCTLGDSTEGTKRPYVLKLVRFEEILDGRSEEHTSELQSPCNL